MNNFHALGLSEAILQVLSEIGFNEPTAIQLETIPKLLQSETDFIGLAQTGTGKTAAFGLPLLQKVDTSSATTGALILAPTRELVQQIAVQLESFSKYIPKSRIQAVYGGASITDQIRALQKTPQIIVATPGRLIDLIKRKKINLESIQYVVLDEADEMLNMGFKEEIDNILAFTPQEKKTWLFSATMPNEIRNIVDQYMNSPQEISINREQRVNEKIEHFFTVIKDSDRTAALMRFLDANQDIRGIVFCRTKIDTQNLANELGRFGYKIEALHGDLSQIQRDKVMAKFKSNKLQLIIATDVAARGIDVNELTHIIHYHIPDSIEYYTHRSGRTARAGKEGISMSLVTKSEFKKLQRYSNKLKIVVKKVALPSTEEIQKNRLEQWADKVLQTKVDTRILGLESDLLEKFATIPMDELVRKLMTIEMDKMAFDQLKDEPTSSKKKDKKSKKRKGKEERSKKPNSNKNTHRFFINLGEIDELDPESLQEFISDQAHLDKDFIESISLREKHAFFEVDKKFSDKISKGFKGVSLDGRKLRVNRDY